MSALMIAAVTGNVGIVRKLIHHGASVNLTNKVFHFVVCTLYLPPSNSSTEYMPPSLVLELTSAGFPLATNCLAPMIAFTVCIISQMGWLDRLGLYLKP